MPVLRGLWRGIIAYRLQKAEPETSQLDTAAEDYAEYM